MAYFLLAAHSKMQEERKRLKEELLSKKEPGLDDLEKFQPKNAKIRGLAVKKACSGEKVNGVAEKHYMSTLEGSKGQIKHKIIHGSPLPSQQKPEV